VLEIAPTAAHAVISHRSRKRIRPFRLRTSPMAACCWADYSTDPPRLLVGLFSW